jgi:hypothetical protein
VRTTLLLALLLSGCAASLTRGTSVANPLVGTWELVRYVDRPDVGPPVYAYGDRPIGLYIFSADGHVSISLMRNPPNLAAPSSDLDPNACLPSWYCSHFGTYTYDPSGPAWIEHVTGANIPGYLATDQRRTFAISGDVLTVSKAYTAHGMIVHAERVLRRVRR